MDRFIKTSLLCLLVKVSYVFSDKCGNGVSCIKLVDCKGLQDGILRGERTFITLFRLLQCGNNDPNGNAMVCCPPEFLNSQPAKTVNTYDDINSAVNLLPNASVCGIQYADRIYGSNRTQLDEHPWLALIRYDKPRGSQFFCGGVLISSRYVLTAAHCVKRQGTASSWTVSQVRLGEWDTSSEVDCSDVECAPPVIDVGVEEIIAHDQFIPDDNLQYDIALLRLERHVPFSDFVKPICLPITAELRDSTFEGQIMEVVGWGKTEIKSNSDVKLKVRVPVVDQSKCRATYKKASREITDLQLCAGGNEGQDSCRGDSGGPLMGQIPTLQNWMVVGVVSYGPSPCGTRGWPGVYTRVTRYLEWILSNMRP